MIPRQRRMPCNESLSKTRTSKRASLDVRSRSETFVGDVAAIHAAAVNKGLPSSSVQQRCTAFLRFSLHMPLGSDSVACSLALLVFVFVAATCCSAGKALLRRLRLRTQRMNDGIARKVPSPIAIGSSAAGQLRINPKTTLPDATPAIAVSGGISRERESIADRIDTITGTVSVGQRGTRAATGIRRSIT